MLFIACEGTSTEYQYFQSWAQSDEVLNWFERVDVYPDENADRPKTTPYQLFEKAKEMLDQDLADIAWIVFDHDNHPRLSDTFLDAQASNVKVAFSSRSFEEWVLLHFQKNSTTFNATECKDNEEKPINCGSSFVPDCSPVDCLIGHIRRENLIVNYSKKKTFDLYDNLRTNTEIAIVNAAWLRFRVGASINSVQPPLETLNPYTDVDQLIYKLQERSDKIEWGDSGTNISLNNWILNAVLIKGNIVVRLSHTRPQSVALNAFFPLPCFFDTNDELNDTPCELVEMRISESSNGSSPNLLIRGDEVTYTLRSNGHPYFLFNNSDEKVRIYIAL
ncbi:MAG: RloB family protein [Flavobacteriales bacterium]